MGILRCLGYPSSVAWDRSARPAPLAGAILASCSLEDSARRSCILSITSGPRSFSGATSSRFSNTASISSNVACPNPSSRRVCHLLFLSPRFGYWMNRIVQRSLALQSEDLRSGLQGLIPLTPSKDSRGAARGRDTVFCAVSSSSGNPALSSGELRGTSRLLLSSLFQRSIPLPDL